MDMNVWICVIIGILIAITAVLAVQVYFLKKTARGIRRAFLEKLNQETKNFIPIFRHEPGMRGAGGGV